MNFKFNLAFLLLTVFFFPSNILPADPPDTLWTKTFGGSNIDIGHSIQQTMDGGFIITGYTRSFGTITGRNIWLIKTDSIGNEVWNNTFGGNSDEEAYSVQQTSDGGYILTGYTLSFGAGENDVILVKTDSLGNELWKKTFGGASDEEGYSVLQTTSGGYIIAGATSSFGAGGRDVWLIKTDAAGNEVWKKTLGGLSSDGARSVQQTSDGGFIITGWTYSSGPGFIGNTLLLKTDSSGNQQWMKAFGGDDVDRGYSVQQTSDNGFIITGYTDSYGAGLYDMQLIKTDAAGNEVWNKTFGGTGRDYGNEVKQTADGGYVVAGYTLSFGVGGDDVWIVKTDALGIEEWNKTLGGTSSDIGYSICQTSDAGFIITGHTLSYGAGVHDVWLVKLEPYVPVEFISFSAHLIDGNIMLSWSTATETNNKGFDIEKGIVSDEYPDNISWQKIGYVEGNGTTTTLQYYSFSDVNVSPGTFYYRLKQIDYDGSFEYSDIVNAVNEIPAVYSLNQNYPNPFNPSTKILYSIPEETFVKLALYDITGRLLKILVNEVKPAGSYEITLNAEDLSAGVYFYELRSESYSDTKKMILLR